MIKLRELFDTDIEGKIVDDSYTDTITFNIKDTTGKNIEYTLTADYESLMRFTGKEKHRTMKMLIIEFTGKKVGGYPTTLLIGKSSPFVVFQLYGKTFKN